MPAAILPIPAQQSRWQRTTWRARSVAGNPAKPSAARRSWPRWSDIVRSAVDRSTARTRHPHAVTLDAAVKLAAVLMLLEEGLERVEQRHAAMVEPGYWMISSARTR